MLNLLVFLIITNMFVFAEYHIMMYFHYMIQEDGMLDRLFGYRKMLDDLYGSESKWKRSLGDALGNCEMCTSFWFAVLWFLVYMAFCKLVAHMWVTDYLTDRKWYYIVFVNIAWFMATHAIIAAAGFLALKCRKKNAV